jgi:hypothetical protein
MLRRMPRMEVVNITTPSSISSTSFSIVRVPSKQALLCFLRKKEHIFILVINESNARMFSVISLQLSTLPLLSLPNGPYMVSSIFLLRKYIKDTILLVQYMPTHILILYIIWCQYKIVYSHSYLSEYTYILSKNNSSII